MRVIVSKRREEKKILFCSAFVKLFGCYDFRCCIILALYCEIPSVKRGNVTSQAEPPHGVYVPHGDMILVECDNGYIASGSILTSKKFQCDRSDPNLPEGSFGVNWDTIACVGKLKVNTEKTICYA